MRFWICNGGETRAILYQRMAKNSFILSDQTKNQYGFVVLTAGINLDRFRNNPVMLYNHENESDEVLPIGRWENIRVENGKLMADPVFDTEDEFAVKIQKKVAGGFIKGASVWVDFKEEDVKLNVPGYEGIPVVVKSELMEGSIVPVPNNKNSIKLTASEKAIDFEFAQKLSAKQNNETNMKDVLLFAASIGITLSASATEDHLREAIKAKISGLETERDSFKTQFEGVTAKLAAKQEAEVTSLIEGGITSKKLKAEQKDHFTKLAKADFESTKAIIDAMVPHQSISEQLAAGNKGGDGGEKKGPFEGKGFKELMKSTEGSNHLAKLRAGTAEEKAEYKKLWEAAYPGSTFNG